MHDGLARRKQLPIFKTFLCISAKMFLFPKLFVHAQNVTCAEHNMYDRCGARKYICRTQYVLQERNAQFVTYAANNMCYRSGTRSVTCAGYNKYKVRKAYVTCAVQNTCERTNERTNNNKQRGRFGFTKDSNRCITGQLAENSCQYLKHFCALAQKCFYFRNFSFTRKTSHVPNTTCMIGAERVNTYAAHNMCYRSGTRSL